MAPMKLRPVFLLAILIYLTLDLSLAMMPGAFQFDLADSVETVQANRARPVEKVVVLPTVPGAGLALPVAPLDVVDGRVWTRPREGLDPLVTAWTPRAARAPAPASQDPH